MARGAAWGSVLASAFPGVRFGRRFRLEPSGEDHELIWLKEEIETGALHRMMQTEPVADDTGVIWTTWGN